MTSDDFNRPGAAARGIVAEVLAFIAQDGCRTTRSTRWRCGCSPTSTRNNEPFRRFCQRRGATPRTRQALARHPGRADQRLQGTDAELQPAGSRASASS